MRPSLRSTVLVLGLFSTVACKPNVAWRDHDPSSLHILGKRQDRLSGPYAEGSTLNLWITAGRKLDGFSVQSGNDRVFEVVASGLDSGGYLHVVGVASGEGTTGLELLNRKGRVIDALEVEVTRPDRFRLIPNALARIGDDLDDAGVDEIRMAADSDVTLAIEVTANGALLAGDGGPRSHSPRCPTPSIATWRPTRTRISHPS